MKSIKGKKIMAVEKTRTVAIPVSVYDSIVPTVEKAIGLKADIKDFVTRAVIEKLERTESTVGRKAS